MRSKNVSLIAIVGVLCVVAYLAFWQHPTPTVEVPGAVVRPQQDFPGSAFNIGIRRIPPEDDGDPGMLTFMTEAIGSSSGTIAFLGERDPQDRRFGSFEERIRDIDDEAFGGRSSRSALAALEEMEASFLLVSTLDPPISPWPPDTASTIRELLRDGVPPPNFQPLVVGRAHILYRVSPPLEIGAGQRRAITTYIRERLADRQPSQLEGLPSDDRARAADGKARVIIALRGPESKCSRGRPISRRTGEGTTIVDALDDASRQLRRGWGRAQERSRCKNVLPDDMDDALGRLTLQVEVVHRMAAISDRSEERLFYNVELGREGVYLRHGSDLHMISPAQTIHRAIDNEHRVAGHLGRWNDLPEEAWADQDNEFGRFETLAWVERRPGDDDPIALYRGVPLVRVQDITRESVVEGLYEAARFLARGQTDAGEYRYIYRPLRTDPEQRWTHENNIVRHGLCPKVVLMAHRLRPDPALVASAKRGIDYTLSHLRRQEDRCHVWHQDEGSDQPNAKMGVVAVTIMSIFELSRVEPIGDYRDELDCLANQLLAMQGSDGNFVHYDVPRGHPYHGRHNTIYPGEIMLALSNLYDFTGEARFKEAFDRALEFQQSWFRREREETESDGIYNDRRRQDLISFEPWGIMAVEDMYRQTDEQQYADFGFELVEFMDGRFHFDFGRAQYADYLGGYFKTQLELPAINSCGYTEGAAAAFGIALRSGQRIEERRLALLLGLRFVMQLQYHPERNLFYVPDPETTSGGFRYNLSYSRIRNDYMYHAMNAFAVAAFTLRPEDYPSNLEITSVPEILQPAFTEP